MANQSPRLEPGTDSALEIIQGRCPPATARSAEEGLLELLAAPESAGARIYRNTTTPGDLSLHLPRPAGTSNPGAASALGLRIAAALRDFGQVSHSVWTPIEPQTELQEEK